MADDFSAEQRIVDESGKANSFFEDYLFQLGRSVGIGTPASASAKGDKGTILADDDYIYACVSDDVWKRVAISTWP